MADELNIGSRRWVICVENQRCIWPGSDAMPEVDISYAIQIADYPDEAQAMATVSDYLAQIGAVATWADVRPVEECAICGQDFSTEKRHKAIALSVETGPETAPEIHSVEYPARICNACEPCK